MSGGYRVSGGVLSDGRRSRAGPRRRAHVRTRHTEECPWARWIFPSPSRAKGHRRRSAPPRCGRPCASGWTGRSASTPGAGRPTPRTRRTSGRPPSAGPSRAPLRRGPRRWPWRGSSARPCSRGAALRRAGVDAERLDSGRCGLAGNFGFERAHLDVNEACAERVLLPRLRAEDESTVVLADGFSCRTQIHGFDSGGHEGVHLAELLASALPGGRDRRGPGQRVRHRAGRPSCGSRPPGPHPGPRRHGGGRRGRRGGGGGAGPEPAPPSSPDTTAVTTAGAGDRRVGEGVRFGTGAPGGWPGPRSRTRRSPS